MARPEWNETVESSTPETEGDDISEKRSKIPEEQRWMSGRSVFFRPEGRASNAARRDIVTTPEERDALSRAHAESTLARRALTSDDLEAEIAAFREWEKNREA